MLFKPFFEYFPDLAKQETRVATVSNHLDLPDAEYALVELYCDTVDCDCRRVMFNVISSQTDEIMAVVGYGWESKKFYAKWMRSDNPKLINDLKGPALNVGSSQTRYAPALLELVEVLLEDKAYVNRLKRHYKTFREHVKANHKDDIIENATSSKKLKIGRNQLCPCGSGKKYKKCCIGTL